MLSLSFLSNFSATISAAFPLGHLIIGTVPKSKPTHFNHQTATTEQQSVWNSVESKTLTSPPVQKNHLSQENELPNVTDTEKRLSTMLSMVASISVSFMSPLLISKNIEVES